jgi:LuxR family maltose regulon positive regulatory protein
MPEPSLLVTKFTTPPVRARLLPRRILIERLNQGSTLPLVLLSAGAGFGKTTLLATWASQYTHPVAWLTLDSLDNDPQRFWSAVVTALRTRLPTIGEGAFARLQEPQPPQLIPLLTSLVNDLVAWGQEVVLIVDDYHLIEERSIHASFGYLLDHAPSCLHLLLSSRVDPPLALSRWRARGQMAEIRDRDLRVSEQEGSLFLQQVMGMQLGAEDEHQLVQRTEG